jgi:hypothetical protein
VGYCTAEDAGIEPGKKSEEQQEILIQRNTGRKVFMNKFRK